MRATNSLLPSLLRKPESGISGVFSQGLQVYGRGGKLIYERFLEPEIITEVVQFCCKEKLSLVAYVGDRIICQQRDAQTDSIVVYKEPLPEEFPLGLERLEELRGLKVNKLIVLAHEEELLRTRPALSTRLEALATITKAQAGMLEILPLGASKGVGVQKLLEHLNIHPERVLAIGDGENDIEMLRMVGLSVAMGNAKEIVQAAAHVVGPRNTDDGVAKVLEEVRRHLDRSAPPRV
jgi:Cof subfamily protein (haloacid dehalogenase superfamily)